MRKLIAIIIAAVAVGVAAAPAGAAPPGNYGQCVKGGLDPSTGVIGPHNPNAHVPSGAVNANLQSGGQSRFEGGSSCTKQP